MTDREKLFELISQVQDCGCDATDAVAINYVENTTLIYHLIANGVTVQKRGEWLRYNGDSWQCSECKEENAYAFSEPLKRFTDSYCPNCGAYMRGKEE